MITVVKHKAGSYWPDLVTLVKCVGIFYCWKIQGVKSFKSKRVFNVSSRYAKDKVNQLDWLKDFGSKSGLNTSCNDELISVYRYNRELKEFESAIYTREGENLKWYNEQQGGTIEQVVELKYWFPVFPWAGGDTPPLNDYRYLLIIEKMNYKKRRIKFWHLSAFVAICLGLWTGFVANETVEFVLGGVGAAALAVTTVVRFLRENN